ncbi:hypothetical protein Tco_1267138 [Tanacetum coccineum]
MAEVSTEAPIMEEVGTQEFSVEDVVIEDYVSSREDGEDAEQSSKDAGTDDDDDVDEENEIVEPDVDVHLFGEDVDVVNADGFDSDPGNDKERNYRKRRLAELRTEMEGVINASGQ